MHHLFLSSPLSLYSLGPVVITSVILLQTALSPCFILFFYHSCQSKLTLEAENHEFQASLGYIGRLYLKKNPKMALDQTTCPLLCEIPRLLNFKKNSYKCMHEFHPETGVSGAPVLTGFSKHQSFSIFPGNFLPLSTIFHRI
jgi:hypothetical protein